MGFTDLDDWATVGGAIFGGIPGALIGRGATNEGFRDQLGNFGKSILGGDETEETIRRRKLLEEQAQRSSDFAGRGEIEFGKLGNESQGVRDRLSRLASGQDSISQMQLNQARQANLNAQRSLASSAGPGNAAMAARNAALNMGRANYGMSGQQALAGIQERNSANEALGAMLAQQRQMELQASLQGRQNAMQGYGVQKPDEREKGYMQEIGQVAQIASKFL